MRILITGGAGFIGSNLAERLIQDGHEVVVFDDLSTGRMENLKGIQNHPRLTFVEGTIGDPETFDPAYMYDTAASCQVWRVYDPLVHTKRESYEEFVGQLADSWEISDDGLTYVFHIREGVKFHEGGDLDAHDAAYSIWRGLLQDRASGPPISFRRSRIAVNSVRPVTSSR